MLLAAFAMMLSAAAPDSAAGNGPAAARAINGGRDWIYISDYPADAVRDGRGGITTVSLVVDRRGAVEECSVVQSSGHRDLDDISCMAMAMRGRYEPARNQRGQKIASTVMRQIVWDPAAIRRAQ
jgi:periplasmic protein TonB